MRRHNTLEHLNAINMYKVLVEESAYTKDVRFGHVPQDDEPDSMVDSKVGMNSETFTVPKVSDAHYVTGDRTIRVMVTFV